MSMSAHSQQTLSDQASHVRMCHRLQRLVNKSLFAMRQLEIACANGASGHDEDRVLLLCRETMPGRVCHSVEQIQEGVRVPCVGHLDLGWTHHLDPRRNQLLNSQTCSDIPWFCVRHPNV